MLQYSISPDGSLTPQSTSSVPAGTDPLGIAADPSGRYVYAVNGGDHTISQYAVGAGGGLTGLSPAAVSLPASTSQGGAFSVSIDPSGHFLYVVVSPPGETFVASPAFIAQYSIGGGGLLTPLTPASLPLSTFASGALVIDSVGRHAYLGGGISGVVLQFSIGSDGTLAPVALAGVAADDPTGVVLAPSGSAAVAEALHGSNLYILTSDALASPPNGNGGHLAHFVLSGGGMLSERDATAIPGRNPTAVALVVAP